MQHTITGKHHPMNRAYSLPDIKCAIIEYDSDMYKRLEYVAHICLESVVYRDPCNKNIYYNRKIHYDASPNKWDTTVHNTYEKWNMELMCDKEPFTKESYAYFPICCYYRELRDEEFGDYFLPKVLRYKKAHGPSEQFKKKCQELWFNIECKGFGNIQDINNLNQVKDLLMAIGRNEEPITEFFHHKLFF